MKLIFEKENLNKVLPLLASVATKCYSIPFTEHVLIDATKERVELTAYDLEIGMRIKAECQIGEPGKTALPAHKLLDIVKNAPEGKIEMESAPADRMKIRCGSANFILVGMSAKELPELSSQDKDSVKISVEGLKDMFRKTAFAVSDDETRHNISGVYFRARGANTMVATDGKRLALVYSPIVIEREIGAIIPVKALGIFAKTFKDGDVAVSEKDNQMVFASESIMITTRLIEGDYPDYEAVIKPSRDNKIEMKVEKDTLVSAIKRVSLVSPKGKIELKMETDQLMVSASAPDIGEAQESIKVKFQGEPLEIALYSRFLMEFLTVVDAEKVVFRFMNGLSPVWMQPEGDSNYEYVIMPVRL